MNQSIANIFYSFLSLFLKSLSGLMLPFLVSSILGSIYFTDFSFYLIIGSLFLVCCEYGSIYWLPNSSQKRALDLKAQFSSGTFHEALNIRLVFFAATALVLSVVVVLGKLSFIDYIFILGIIQYSFFSLFYYSFRSFGLFKHELKLSLLVEVVSFVVPTVCILFFRNYEIFVLTFFGTRLVLTFFLFSYYRLVPRVSIFAAAQTLSKRFFYFFQMAISAAVLYADTFLVRLFYPSELYLHQGFLRLSILFCFFIPILNSILLYYMNRSYLVSGEQYTNFFKQLMVLVFPLVSLFAMFSYMTFGFFSSYFLGAEYSDLNSYSFEFSALIFFKYLSSIFGLNLTIIGLQNLRANILFVVLLLGLVGFYFGFRELEFSHVFDLIVLFNLVIFSSYLVSTLRMRH